MYIQFVNTRMPPGRDGEGNKEVADTGDGTDVPFVPSARTYT